MLRDVPATPRIAIVGPGNLGSALAVSLRRAGFRIEAIVGRKSSLRRAQRLARAVGSHAGLMPDHLRADVVWFCVPDAEIAPAAQALAEKFPSKGTVALHSSGVLTSDVLRPLSRKGVAVASAHPLMTFVKNSGASLEGVPFAIEGDAAGVSVARAIVSKLGGYAYPIRKKDKAAYHAWGTFASPLLTALLATTERVARLSGTQPETAMRRMLPILRQTLENFAAFGPGGGFSGPIVRGDIGTVTKHLKVLRSVPAAREVYVALAKAALQYLPVKDKSSLRRILNSQG